MSAALRDVPRRLSTDEFLQWLENRAETERWELIDGEPVRGMSPETVRHVELKRNALESLRDGLRAAGLPCRAFGDGVAVRVDPRSYFQPDASLTCAEHVDPDAIEVPEPIVVVEVVSPGTRVRDQTVKLVDYFTVPSVQHYLLIETRRRLVLHHRRGAEGEVVTRFLHAGRLRLDPPGVEVEIAALYAGTDVA
jgi:Uma2 family endonuclease